MKEKKRDVPVLYVLKFLIFALIFIGIGTGICALWGFIGESGEARGAAPTGGGDRIRVVIDAGHGGADGGAVGTNSVAEKDLNLDIALMLRDMLTAAGVNVVMTRTEDIMLTDGQSGGSKKNQDLSARLKIAESSANTVFVSIHMNSFPIEKYSGLQVYYSPNNEKSRLLADSIQSLTREHIQPENNRKIKSATDSILLLDRMTCPSVLVECGFLSNQAECEKLCDKTYRRQLAFVLCCAIYDSIFPET